MFPNSLLRYFMPKDNTFFPLLERMSDNLIEMAKHLVEAVNKEDAAQRIELFQAIEDYEHRCDEITHQVHLQLGKRLFTPFDRSDIHTLVNSLDDVADFIHGSSTRMHLYKLVNMTDPIRDMADLILEATVEVSKAIHELRDLRYLRNIADSCVRINSIENKADDIFDRAVGQLFDYETNAIELIKYKEVLAAMETATDRCEDVADVLESILVKHA